MEVEKNKQGGFCIVHDENQIQIKNLSTKFTKDMLEQHAQRESYIYDPDGTRFISRALLYQIRGVPGLYQLNEGETFQIDVTFESGDRLRLENLTNCDILKAIDF